MKILHINMTCEKGSTGRLASVLSQKLDSNGHEAYVAYGYYDSKLKNSVKLLKGKTKRRVQIELIRSRISGYHGFTNVRATNKLIYLIKEIKPDIIHLSNIHGGYINIRTLFNFLKNAKLPIVWTLHDCWAFTGHCAYFSLIGCEKWKVGCNNCPNLKSYPKSWFFDRSKKQYFIKKSLFSDMENVTLITPSKWLYDLVGESYLSNYPRVIIPNAIDTDEFKFFYDLGIEEKYNLQNKKIVLAVANAWSERKGMNYVIEASKKMKENYQFIIVGLNDKQLKSIPENIVGIKRTDSVEELVKLYSIADVFINPTLEEMFGMTNIEALSCGTPVITFDTGGSVECIDENTGLVVEQRNLEELINAIIEITKNKNKYTLNCRKRAVELYNFDRYYNQYIELYNRVLSKQDN